MLHRLSLRVLPQLNGAVTEPEVRKRKRLVMLLPGVVAFGLYRVLNPALPLSDPWVLLGFSGLVSALAALWAFRMGRQQSIARIFSEETPRRIAWIVGWVGFAYGVQLSLLVLALLAIFVQYDFLLHPDGPAMMAMIIPTTAVTRDAFELGHVRKLVHEGMEIVTHPDGTTLRLLVWSIPMPLVQWGLMALVSGLVVSWIVPIFPESVYTHAIRVLTVSASIGLIAYGAFLAGQAPTQPWKERVQYLTWWKGLQFWTWPCFTFAMTYYLVTAGIVKFLLRLPVEEPIAQILMSGSASLLMVVYFYYLGTRVFIEGQVRGEISEGMRRCPFVMEILSKTGWVSTDPPGSSVSFSGSQTK